jgi:4-oxalocrotonate tautomerase
MEGAQRLPSPDAPLMHCNTRHATSGFGRAAGQEKENVMPFVNVKLIEGVFTAEQKKQIVHDLTEAMVNIEGENMRSVTWVVVEEVRSGHWGIGGNPLNTADVKALAAGVTVA